MIPLYVPISLHKLSRYFTNANTYAEELKGECAIFCNFSIFYVLLPKFENGE